MKFPGAGIVRWLRKSAPAWDPVAVFQSAHYLRHNQKRQEHLDSLNLDLRNRSVLEVGAGIGDHTQFFLDRDCQVVSTEARKANLDVLRHRYPDLRTEPLNLDAPAPSFTERFDIVYCYGVLYHLNDPAAALAFMARCTRDLLLLETRVSFGSGEAVNSCDEDTRIPSHSVHGKGCRPSRPWVFRRLQSLFPFVYMPLTQPAHEEFPLDWTTPPTGQPLTRSVFIAARQAIHNPLLVEAIPMLQRPISHADRLYDRM